MSLDAILQLYSVQNSSNELSKFRLNKPYYNCEIPDLLSYEFNKFAIIINESMGLAEESQPQQKFAIPKLTYIETIPKKELSILKLTDVDTMPKKELYKLKTVNNKKRKRKNTNVKECKTKEDEVKERKRISAKESRRKKKEKQILLTEEVDELKKENNVMKRILKIYNISHDAKN